MLCLLSGRYPFFRAADDLSTLAELTTLLGTAAVRKAAAGLGMCICCCMTVQDLGLKHSPHEVDQVHMKSLAEYWLM